MQRESIKTKGGLKKSTRARTAHADSVRKSKQSALNKRRRLPSQEMEDVDDLEFQSLLLALASDDEATVVAALERLKAALSAFDNERMDKVAESGVTAILLQLLARPSSTTVELTQVLWCLTHITSGLYEHTKEVLPAVPTLLNLLANAELAEHAAWTLGNIAADCEEFRLYLIRHGAITPLVQRLRDGPHDQSMTKGTIVFASTPSKILMAVCLWALSNMARGVQTPAKAFFDCGIGPILLSLLTAHESSEVAQELLWVLAFLTAKEDKALQWLLEHDLVRGLLQYFESTDELVLTPLLRVCGNVATTSPDHHTDGWQLQHITALAAEPRFLYMLRRVLQTGADSHVVAEAAWVLSNLAARDEPTVALLAQYDLLGPLAHAFCDSTFDIRKEASFALANVGRTSAAYLERVLAIDNVLEGYIGLLSVADISVVANALQFVQHVLGSVPQSVYTIESLGGIDALESIQERDSGDLGRLAQQLMDQYYGDEYEPLVSPKAAAPIAFDPPPVGGGRGAHMTKPAWAT
ncbi:importin subunit alpha [Achlya hypogyna]|uniref:Importin subunit alpha n=1 Tax=Achlya hypogyna TaxID=1202772 RepID=A0A1V9Y9N3_ACHHY|nr:importin subunit alpha [Achlya hypogyna]